MSCRRTSHCYHFGGETEFSKLTMWLKWLWDYLVYTAPIFKNCRTLNKFPVLFKTSFGNCMLMLIKIKKSVAKCNNSNLKMILSFQNVFSKIFRSGIFLRFFVSMVTQIDQNISMVIFQQHCENEFSIQRWNTIYDYSLLSKKKTQK